MIQIIVGVIFLFTGIISVIFHNALARGAAPIYHRLLINIGEQRFRRIFVFSGIVLVLMGLFLIFISIL
jgi:hypothetical protein